MMWFTAKELSSPSSVNVCPSGEWALRNIASAISSKRERYAVTGFWRFV